MTKLVEFTEQEVNSLLMLLTGLVEEPWVTIRLKLEQEQSRRNRIEVEERLKKEGVM